MGGGTSSKLGLDPVLFKPTAPFLAQTSGVSAILVISVFGIALIARPRWLPAPSNAAFLLRGW